MGEATSAKRPAFAEKPKPKPIAFTKLAELGFVGPHHGQDGFCDIELLFRNAPVKSS